MPARKQSFTKEEGVMSTKLMEMNHQLDTAFAKRFGLEIIEGFVARRVWEGGEVSTVYVYGSVCGQPFNHDGQDVVEVAEVHDSIERERVMSVVAAAKKFDLKDVRWAKF
jgi:hypothetical protein